MRAILSTQSMQSVEQLVTHPTTEEKSVPILGSMRAL